MIPALLSNSEPVENPIGFPRISNSPRPFGPTTDCSPWPLPGTARSHRAGSLWLHCSSMTASGGGQFRIGFRSTGPVRDHRILQGSTPEEDASPSQERMCRRPRPKSAGRRGRDIPEVGDSSPRRRPVLQPETRSGQPGSPHAPERVGSGRRFHPPHVRRGIMIP